MSDFNFDLFTQPDQYEETLLRDRKAFVEYWRDDKKAELLKDVIALANTARMLGKPAYLILGVRDGVDGTPNDICGIGEMFEQKSLQGKTEKQAQETIRQEMAGVIHQYIQPLLSPVIHFAKYREKVVGYVLIPPLTTEPFRVSQEFRSGRETYLRQGQCWLRFGESKGEVKPEELAPDHDKLRYCYAEAPYVLPSIWQRYFEQVQRDMLKLTSDAPEESAYQELRSDKGISIAKIMNDFLSQDDDERWLILQGAAGCGKSLFLQRLVKSLAQNGEQEMHDAQRLEQFVPPSGFIPLYYRLRDLTPQARTDSAHFTKMLCNLLTPLWQDNHDGRRPSQPERLFENPRSHWLIVLDGLDEIGAHERRREFLKVLIEFMQTYPRLRVILSTRPGLPLQNEQAKLVEIAPLDEKQVEDFLMAYRTDRNDIQIDAFIESYKAWEDARKLLSVPVYLNAALSAVGVQRKVSDTQLPPENPPLQSEVNVNTDEPQEASENNPQVISAALPEDASLEVEKEVTSEPTKRDEEREEHFVDTLPRLLERVYQAFWEREEKRGAFENLKRLQSGTYKLAASRMNTCAAYVQRNHVQRLFTEKGLRWVLEMGVLDDDNEWQHIRFTIPSAQVYSAAKQVQGDIEGGFLADVVRYMRRWQEAYRAEIESFYNDLTGNSLSTILHSQGGSNG